MQALRVEVMRMSCGAVCETPFWVALQASKKIKDYINPRDKGAKSKPLTEYLCTVEMEAALEKYRDACTEANDRVSRELKSLAEALEVRTPPNQPLVIPTSFIPLFGTVDSVWPIQI